MSQWTFVDPNTLLPGDPWTSAKAQAAFENLEAAIKSAPGAPRPLTEEEFRAAQPFVSTAGEVLVGPFVHSGTFNTRSTSFNTYGPTDSITILSNVSGVLRFRTGYTATSGVSTQFRLMKNDTEVFIFTGASGASGSEFTDQTVAAGDVFRWEVRRTGDGGFAAIQPEQPRGSDNIESRGLLTYGSQA